MNCNFGVNEGEMLRDQLVERAYEQAVKKELLMKTDIGLDEAVALATRVELALKAATLLTSPAAPI